MLALTALLVYGMSTLNILREEELVLSLGLAGYFWASSIFISSSNAATLLLKSSLRSVALPDMLELCNPT